MSTLFAIYFISKIFLNPLLRDRVVSNLINYSRESRIFAYRVSLMWTIIINNIPYIKICEYFRIYIVLGSFAQPKCDGFLDWMNRSLYHTLERNGHQKVRANFLAWQLQSEGLGWGWYQVKGGEYEVGKGKYVGWDCGEGKGMGRG